MSIALTHTWAWPEVRRGGERYLHELASALADAGHRVEVVASAPQASRSQVLGVPVVYTKRRHPAQKRYGPSAPEVAFALAAAAHLVPRRIDVWHALGAPDAAAAALLGPVARFRSAYTVLGVPARSYQEARPDRRFHDVAARRVDEYICLSGAAARALREGWGREAAVVGGGVDTRRYQPGGQRSRRPALLYSGSFDAPHKNLPLLMEAMDHLLRRVPEAELWLSGQGSPDPVLAAATERVRSAVRCLGVGAEEDQAGRYREAWATVLPSENEAFGLCLVESLACGTPIVVLAGGGGPAEIVRPGVGVATERSAESLAAGMEEALDLSCQKGTAGACRSVAMGYDWRVGIVPQLERLYGR